MSDPRILLLLAGSFLASCSGNTDRPSQAGDFDGGLGTLPVGVDACVDDQAGPPGPDAYGLCGNTFLEATTDTPNLYFVVDRSGSMGEVIKGREKYTALTVSLVRLVRSLGAGVNVGAAIFPGPGGVLAGLVCAPGEEVLAVTPGSASLGGSCAEDGPTTAKFARAVVLPGGATPKGATPTAATLASLLPRLRAVPGRTAVILATDGGPNCNFGAACGADKCMPNLEKARGCVASINCCGADTYGPESCLDEGPTLRAVSDLLAAGIKTYVLGVPGSGVYASLLGELAAAGGTARKTNPTYYDVADLGELDNVLSTIGARATLGCHLHLQFAPPNTGLVNIYLDRKRIPFNSANGWAWSRRPAVSGDGAAHDAASQDVDGKADVLATGGEAEASAWSASAEASASSVEASATDAGWGSDQGPGTSDLELDLLGEACTSLESGTVRRVQVVFGCPSAEIN